MVLALQLLDVQQLYIIIKKNKLKVNSLFSIYFMKNLKIFELHPIPILFTLLNTVKMKENKKINTN